MIFIDLSLFFTNYVMRFIEKYSDKDSDELEIIHYGMEVFFINLFKCLLLAGAAFFLGIIKPLIILFISFACLRLFAAGVHAPSSLTCTIINFVMFLGGTYLGLYIPIGFAGRLILFVSSLILLIRYAPADTEDRPLISSKLRKKLKREAVIAVFFLFLVTLFLKNEVFKNLITCGVMLEALLTTPVIYYILGKGYKNYEKINECNDGNR